jgi:hypothetical protein
MYRKKFQSGMSYWVLSRYDQLDRRCCTGSTEFKILSINKYLDFLQLQSADVLISEMTRGKVY